MRLLLALPARRLFFRSRRFGANGAVAASIAAAGREPTRDVPASGSSLGGRAPDGPAREAGVRAVLLSVLLLPQGLVLERRAVAEVAAGEAADLGPAAGVARGVGITERTAGRSTAIILAVERLPCRS